MLGINCNPQQLTTSISFSLKYQEASRYHHCALHAQLTRCYAIKPLTRVQSVVDSSPTHLLRAWQVRPLAAIVRMRSCLLFNLAIVRGEVDITKVSAYHNMKA